MPSAWENMKPLASAGLELGTLLHHKGIKQVEVVRRVRAKGGRLSVKGISAICNGRLYCSPKKFNLILDCCDVSVEERLRLNQAAARDVGWVIGWLPVRKLMRRYTGVWTRKPRQKFKIKSPNYKVDMVDVTYAPRQSWPFNCADDTGEDSDDGAESSS